MRHRLDVVGPAGRRDGSKDARELALRPRSRGGELAIVWPALAPPPVAASPDTRAQYRRRTRLQAAKILDLANAFICEALIQDRSADGMRLLLARNVGLPLRFGVHDDSTGEVVTVAAAWRRGQTIGVRVLRRGPLTPLKRTDRHALLGRYYGIRD